jgi:hypothetical protein
MTEAVWSDPVMEERDTPEDLTPEGHGVSCR